MRNTVKPNYVLKALVICTLIIFSTSINAQDRPRLVVGIVVDQMRYDYLYKYWDDYGDNGFKRLMLQGQVVQDGHYHYAPTYTGPGHASIYTGSSPALHGIIANEWYSRQAKRFIYCTEDQQVNSVGTVSPNGKMSPRNMTATTVTDQLELATGKKAKTYGISIKDRGAILPAGYLTDGAYWYDASTGHFITSDYYRSELPEWVKTFNNQDLVNTYMDQIWTPLLPLDQYNESWPDDSRFERPFTHTEKAVFPYDLKTISALKRFGISNSKTGLLPITPYGNTLLFEFAKTLVHNEKLGEDNITDLLAISFSTPDYAGHQFGAHSMELQDIYLRLDRELGQFLDFIDQNIGLKQTLFFLTADHGAADAPGLISPPAGYFKSAAFEDTLRKYLVKKLGDDPIENISNQQIFFRNETVSDLEGIRNIITPFALSFPGVHSILNLHDLSTCMVDEGLCNRLKKGVMPGRSGDLYVQYYPGWIDEWAEKGGTTHGSAYAYDTHVPILFFGWKIKPGESYTRTYIQDIAPTVCQLLKLTYPSGCTGTPIKSVLE